MRCIYEKGWIILCNAGSRKNKGWIYLITRVLSVLRIDGHALMAAEEDLLPTTSLLIGS